MINIVWKKKAIKQLKKIPETQRKTIYDEVSELTNFPNVNNIKALVNHKYDYRMRVGRYRVLFNLQETLEIISIEEVKKRDDHTY